jgi:hypothetical protein
VTECMDAPFLKDLSGFEPIHVLEDL